MRKTNKVSLLLSIVCLIIMTVGSSLAFFNATIKSDNVVTTKSYKFSLNLLVIGEYTNNNLIPMYDKDALKGYNNKCVDNLGNSVCQSYKITLENTGDMISLDGYLTLNKDNISNLSYMILDNNNNIYQNATSSLNGGKLSLGPTFTLNSSESKIFTLVIWLSDTGKSQNEEDASGSFTGVITYKSADGANLSASIGNQ